MSLTCAIRLPRSLSAWLWACLTLCSLAIRFTESRHLSASQCEIQNFPLLSATSLDASATDLQWVDADDKVVFAKTSAIPGVWRSKDGGSTFENLTPRLNASIHGSERIEILNIFSQKSKRQNILFIGSGTHFWVSDDYGATFTVIETPTKWKGSLIRSIKLHPRVDNWILLLVRRPDCRSYDKLHQECPCDLMLSQDMFSKLTWTNLTEVSRGQVAGFVDFDWMASVCPNNDCGGPPIPDEGIMATEYEVAGSYDQPWDPDVNFATSVDFFKSHQTRVKCGNQFEVVGNAVYLALANSCPTNIDGRPHQGPYVFPQGITLYTSVDLGHTFVQACLPIALKQEGFELTPTHDGKGAIVIVDYRLSLDTGDIPASSIYKAGPHHALFSLSLSNVFHSDFGFATDFSYLDGLSGIYVANQMLPRNPGSSGTGSTGRRLLDEFDDFADAYYYDDGYYDLDGLTEKPLVETRISFDGGARWARINAPKTFKNSACDRCNYQTECYLHLYGMSDWETTMSGMPSVYSSASAPGLVFGTGNVGVLGVGLGDNDAVCTFMSTDGGVTWSDVEVGTYIYEFADWGGVIVMARYPGSSGTDVAEEIKFSLDYGQCWQTVSLAEAMFVDNIRIEPDGQRPRVLVHGHACRKSTHQSCRYEPNDPRHVDEGLVVVVDIPALMKEAKIDVPQCTPTAYEEWTIPTATYTPRCLLGQTMRFTRRKASVLCFNGADYQRPAPVNATCSCTFEDIECDYGYVRNGNMCEKLPSSSMPVCPVVSDHKYTVSTTGKRLVHGDVCTNASAVIADTDGQGNVIPGPPSSGSATKKGLSGGFKFFLVLLVFVVLGGAFTAWWIFLASDDQRDNIISAIGMGLSAASRAWDWVLTKCVPSRRRGAAVDVDLGYFQPLGGANEGSDDMFGARK